MLLSIIYYIIKLKICIISFWIRKWIALCKCNDAFVTKLILREKKLISDSEFSLKYNYSTYIPLSNDQSVRNH